jgi:hypothetical protein
VILPSVTLFCLSAAFLLDEADKVVSDGLLAKPRGFEFRVAGRGLLVAQSGGAGKWSLSSNWFGCWWYLLCQ